MHPLHIDDMYTHVYTDSVIDMDFILYICLNLMGMGPMHMNPKQVSICLIVHEKNPTGIHAFYVHGVNQTIMCLVCTLSEVNPTMYSPYISMDMESITFM